MTIWTSRPLAALGLIAGLSACDAADTGGGTLLAALAPPQDAALPPVPLRQAAMMRGAVTLVPPQGYCIDPLSLTQSFALMARCDTLGAATGGSGAPAGVLTVSFARSPAGTPLPSAAQIAGAANLAPPQQIRRSSASVLFQTRGTAPSDALSPTHWRAVAQMGGVVMGAALFGPEGRRAVTGEGAELLQEMIIRTATETIGS